MKNLLSRSSFAAPAAIVIALAVTPSAKAVEVAGFRFDDTARLGNTELLVNGTGIRSKFGRRYAMALYLPAKTGDAKAALTAKGPKRIAIVLIKDISGETFADAVSKGIGNNSSDVEKAALKERIQQLADTVVALGEIKAGSNIVFDWLPDRGCMLAVDGQIKGREIAGEDFYTALLKVWLGEEPVQNDLKQGLLGKTV